jgi:hypothetical protein
MSFCFYGAVTSRRTALSRTTLSNNASTVIMLKYVLDKIYLVYNILLNVILLNVLLLNVILLNAIP